MNKKILMLFLGCAIAFLAGISNTLGQQEEISLKDKQITIKFEKQHIAVIFRYLMENYSLHIGFEESILDRGHNDYNFETNLPKKEYINIGNIEQANSIKLEVEQVFQANQHLITVNSKNARLEEVFNIIIPQMKNYEWKINNDVINIFPTKGRDERFKKLLDTNINNFTLEEGEQIKAITTKIIALPELYKFLNENKLEFTGVRGGFDSHLKAKYGKKLDAEINFSNLTFQELLNKITKIKKGGWIFRWKSISSSGNEHIDIDI